MKHIYHNECDQNRNKNLYETQYFVFFMAVNNFQSIRTELFKEIQGAKQKLKRESKLQELAENLEKKRL